MRRRRQARQVVLSGEDVAILMALVSTLDPDTYAKPAAKAMILRCKDAVDRLDEGEVVLRIV